MFGKLFTLAALVLMGVGIHTLFGPVAAYWFGGLIAVGVLFKLLPGRIIFGALSVIFVKPLMVAVLGGLTALNVTADLGYVADTYAYGSAPLWGVLLAVYSFFAFAPETWIRNTGRAIAKPVLRALFGFKIQGFEKYLEAEGKRKVLCPTHPSFKDPVFIIAAVPDKVSFAINDVTAEEPHFKFLTRFGAPFADLHKVSMTDAFSLKELIEAAKEESRVIGIFPEGRLSYTGTLSKIQNGPAMVASHADAVVIGIKLEGLQFSLANRMKGKLRRQAFPPVTLTFNDAKELEKKKGRAARGDMQMEDLMTDTMFKGLVWKNQTLYGELVRSASLHGYNHSVWEHIDPETHRRVTLTYKQALIGTRVLEKKLAGIVNKGEVTGLMLPNAGGSAVAFFALHRMGAVPAMLNFTAGSKSVLACCEGSEVQTVLTSRTFLRLAAEKKNTMPQDIIDTLEKSGRKIVYLDDIRETVTMGDQASAALTYGNWDDRIRNPEDPAVVLFTSGSEGTPKGVVLSHQNLLANRAQMKSLVGFTHQDTVLNAMPMFHSFGLLAGMILPAMEGVKTFMYPSPLDYKTIPLIAYDINATIMFGTDAFLQGYAKQAHTADFGSMRMIFAGAEKVKDETRRTYADSFSTIIYEGYGATECAPVIAVNTPKFPKPGSVGRFVPGLEYKLEPFPGFDDGGRLYVRGPNVMLGYYRHDKPGVLEAPEGGWHDTGDIVTVDDKGFVTIVGRAKRFAKIGGEMVALPVTDELAAKAWPDFNHASVAVKHESKGQQILLVTENPDADRKKLSELASKDGVASLAVPAKILVVEEIPLLGSGKVDFGALNELVAEKYGE